MAEGQMMTLCRSLDTKRFDLEFACLRRVGPFVKEIEDQGLPLTEYRFSSFRSVSALRQQMKLALANYQRGGRYRDPYSRPNGAPNNPYGAPNDTYNPPRVRRQPPQP